MEAILRQVLSLLVMAMTLAHSSSFRLLNAPPRSNAIEEERGPGMRQSLFFEQELTSPVTVMPENGNLVLKCEATGTPTPTIHWLYNGNRLPQGHSGSVLDDQASYEQTTHNEGLPMFRLGTTKGRLHLDCLTVDDIGLYTCVVESPMHTITSQTFLQIDRAPGHQRGCALSTGIPARVYMWESLRLEYEGADVQLFCRASGFPIPQITWYDRNNDVITRQNHRYRLLKNGDLLVKNVSWNEHMGEFKCVATNQHGDDEVTSFLYPTEP